MGERLQANPLRFTTTEAAMQTRVNLSAVGAASGPLANRPTANSTNQNMFWIADDGSLYYSNGSSWTAIATGTGTGPVAGGITSYSRIHTYQAVSNLGEEVWIRAQATTHAGVTWSRSNTTLTVNGSGTIIGDLVCVYDAATPMAFGVVVTSGPGSFTITVPNTGGSSGSAASFAIVPKFQHDATGPTKRGGILSPGKPGTQVLSMTIHTGDRDATYDGNAWISSGYYYLTVPTDGGAGLRVTENVGNNTDVWNSLMPMLPANGVYSRSMTRVIGAFANYDMSAGVNYSKIRFEGLGQNPVLIRIAF